MLICKCAINGWDVTIHVPSGLGSGYNLDERMHKQVFISVDKSNTVQWPKSKPEPIISIL